MACCPRCTVLLVAASLLNAAALKEHAVIETAAEDNMDFDESSGPKYPQRLESVRDVQYWGKVLVGGQVAAGILDTGSFELVLHTQSCRTCGAVSLAYDERHSDTYLQGQLRQVYSQGRRNCLTEEGFDKFHLGPFGADKQGMWFTRDCNVPLFYHEGFTALVGLGPPGQPEHAARQRLRQLHELENSYKAKHEELPVSLSEEKVYAKRQLAAALAKPAVLESFDVRVFSFCLGRGTGSPGWMIWNDETRSGKPGVRQLPVASDHSWAVKLQHVRMNGRLMGCADGCAALVDTGSSLLAMSTPIYDSILAALRELQLGDADCSNLTGFPELTMTVGGSQLVRLPPSSYIGVFYGQMSSAAEPFLRLNSSINAEGSCQFLAADLGTTGFTNLGPLVVLGMPFFREYYTTFDLGHGPHDRSIFVSEADENCKPTTHAGTTRSHTEREAEATLARKVDLSKLQMPRWVEGHGDL